MEWAGTCQVAKYTIRNRGTTHIGVPSSFAMVSVGVLRMKVRPVIFNKLVARLKPVSLIFDYIIALESTIFKS